MTSDRFMIQFCKISNYFSDKNTQSSQVVLQFTSVLLQKIDIFVSDLCKMLGGAGKAAPGNAEFSIHQYFAVELCNF